uniref:Uncharacterized protein n=1 Tax=Timema cristinae TaxID=61476 RepID=A0A7R9CK29_TIMCR|nr:unnamed protein product [Timema cristinae]
MGQFEAHHVSCLTDRAFSLASVMSVDILVAAYTLQVTKTKAPVGPQEIVDELLRTVRMNGHLERRTEVEISFWKSFIIAKHNYRVLEFWYEIKSYKRASFKNHRTY